MYLNVKYNSSVTCAKPFLYLSMNLSCTTLCFFAVRFLACNSQYTPISTVTPGLHRGFFVGPGVYQPSLAFYRQDRFASLADAKSIGAGLTVNLRTGLILQTLN